MKPRQHAAKIMTLPKDQWIEYIENNVEPHLHEMVKVHVRIACERRKWIK